MFAHVLASSHINLVERSVTRSSHRSLELGQPPTPVWETCVCIAHYGRIIFESLEFEYVYYLLWLQAESLYKHSWLPCHSYVHGFDYQYILLFILLFTICRSQVLWDRNLSVLAVFLSHNPLNLLAHFACLHNIFVVELSVSMGCLSVFVQTNLFLIYAPSIYL